MEKPLISIVIPTYNRAHLIGETLDSILAQTYKNWECIVVDDGSSDHTDQIMHDYCKEDNRIKYHHRQKKYTSGGNGARNYGLFLAIGDFVIFFDSDDLMTTNHLAVKLNALNSGKFDFSITKTKYFNSNKSLDYCYDSNYEISFVNFLFFKFIWLTLDVCIRTDIAKKINFSENLTSGQEYNYFCKLLLKTENGIFIDKVVSLRRYHDNSIRSNLKTSLQLNQSKITSKISTLKDIQDNAPKDVLNIYLFSCIQTAAKNKLLFKENLLDLTRLTIKQLGFRGGILVPLMYVSEVLFRRNHYFRKKLKLRTIRKNKFLKI